MYTMEISVNIHTLRQLNLFPDKWSPMNPLKKRYPKRKDKVDMMYRHVYRKWCGKPYDGKHPTHLPVGCRTVIPDKQKIPGYCLLCPMTDIYPSLCRLRRHYNHLHVKYQIVVKKTVMLACKCSQIKNQGTDGSCRNMHYHCYICNWPRVQKHHMFIHLTTQYGLNMKEVGHLERAPKPVRELEKELAAKKKARAAKKNKGKK